MKIKTRFAPSPTGYLHLGGARTALFAWAFAKKHKGEFLLRIEDTDAQRSDKSHSDAIILAMDWLGLTPDGKVQYQSANHKRHLEVANELQKNGAAYEDEGALRLRIPDSGGVSFDDLVCGRLAVENKELKDKGWKEGQDAGDALDNTLGKDPVILRADKTPTYIFASAIDDMDSGISHVIRGDDHIRNTHKQLHIYKALSHTPPQFAHLPMIYGADGTRLSKRHAAVDVMQYAEEGFLPQAMVNYLARLSWSHGDAEVFDMDFLSAHFDFDSISRSPARFDRDKLVWLNGVYIRELSRDDMHVVAYSYSKFGHFSAGSKMLEMFRKSYKQAIKAMKDSGAMRTVKAMEERDYAMAIAMTSDRNVGTRSAQSQLLSSDGKLSDGVINLIQPRADTLRDVQEQVEYFINPVKVPNALAKKYLTESAKTAMQDLHGRLESLSDWTATNIKSTMKETMKECGLKFPQVGMPMRVLLTAREQSPDIAEVAEVLGKDETLWRLMAGSLMSASR